MILGAADPMHPLRILEKTMRWLTFGFILKPTDPCMHY
jgi:hypothetical protein